MKQVSVVIPSSYRPQLLRALHSIEHQDYRGSIEVLVVTPNPDLIREKIAGTIESMKRHCRIVSLELTQQDLAENPLLEMYAWSNAARRRNIGTACATGEFVCHLGDDDEFQPNHISSLVEVLDASPDLPLAFSWRRLLCEDGTPYTANVYPWIKQPNLAHARYIFQELVRFGISTPDSCEMHDQLIGPQGEELLTVDVSEWLIRREFHLQFPFTEHFTFREVSHGLTEDYLFCKSLVKAGIPVGCTRQATVNYYLGGRTTRWLQDALRESQRGGGH